MPVCVACDWPFDQVYTVGLGPSPVPDELQGERCVVCNGAHAYATNELIVCGCATCADADPIFRKAVHLGCTGCDGYGKVWRKVPTGEMFFENASTGESHVPSSGLSQGDRVFAFYDFHRYANANGGGTTQSAASSPVSGNPGVSSLDAGASAAADDDDSEGVSVADSDYSPSDSDVSETEPAGGLESDADEADEADEKSDAGNSASVASSTSAASVGGAAPGPGTEDSDVGALSVTGGSVAPDLDAVVVDALQRLCEHSDDGVVALRAIFDHLGDGIIARLGGVPAVMRLPARRVGRSQSKKWCSELLGQYLVRLFGAHLLHNTTSNVIGGQRARGLYARSLRLLM